MSSQLSLITEKNQIKHQVNSQSHAINIQTDPCIDLYVD